MSERTALCEWCGESFDVPKRNPDQSFCDLSCANKQRNANRGFTIGGVKSPRKSALKRDNYTCQRCGCDVDEEHQNTPRSVEVHHLIPRAAGGPDTVENLVTLCRRCHKEAHTAISDIDETNPELLKKMREIICKDADAVERPSD